MAVVETNSKNSIRSFGVLPEVIVLQALHEGNIVFKRSSVRDIGGFMFNSGPNFYPDENCACLNEAETTDSATMEDGNGYKKKIALKSISVIRRDLPESNLGWPLLPKSNPLVRDASRKSKARSMSLVEWVMSLPSRSSETIMHNPIDDSDLDESSMSLDSKTEASASTFQMFYSCENKSFDGSSTKEDEKSGSFSAVTDQSAQLRPGWPLLRVKTSSTGESLEESESNNQSTQTTPKSQFYFHLKEEENSDCKFACIYEPKKLTKKKEIVLKLQASGCKQFTYKELERATHKFSSENLIGEGGCSNVYRGCICWGKLVAVKVLKPYKDSWNDFSLEVDIMCSLKHKHITNLIGACVEDNHLILVYNFLSKGSLADILQGEHEKCVFPWKDRFKLAIAIAEALNYLHKECPRPVIHRDVKSSNILLSNDFEPELSDFGLAIWAAADSTYTMCSDIAGTFGYIAPEYFTHGRVSEKIDIYSFGVVLLELLTGNKPISSTGPKGQESLVKWAMPLLESGNLEALLDPKLGGEFNVVQMHRMVLAATLCIKQSPRLRPKANQVLKLLREEEEIRKWMHNYISNIIIDSSNEEFDDLSPEVGCRPSSDSSFLSSNEDDSYLRRGEQKHRLKLKDYLNEQQD